MTAVTGYMNPAARLGIEDVGRPNNFSGSRCWAEDDSAVLLSAFGGDVRVRRRMEIIAETQEQVVVRRAGRDAVAWCVACGEPARMLTLDKAMALTGASSREIHRRLEAGDVHFTETPEGFVLTCMNSLLKSN